jgi:prepilin-type N-terminal cleavage/methylation domain-containing protein
MSLARTPLVRRSRILLLLSGLIAASSAMLPLAAHEPSATQESIAIRPSPSNPLAMEVPSPAGDLRDALARTVIERNTITTQRDSLIQQRWLIIAYATFASLLAAWFIRAHLRRPAQTGAVVPPEVQSTTKVTKRANATITIRNAATQKAESISRMTTRKLFRYRTTMNAESKTTPPASAPAPAQPPSPQRQFTGATTTVFRTTATRPPPSAIPVTTPSAAPVASQRPGGPDYNPTDAPANSQRIGHQRSILLGMEADDLAPEPAPAADETTNVRIARRDGQVLSRQGLSLLEVMISLAILGTVMASVSGGIFSLTTAKRAASEEVLVSNLMQMWSERIMGADWEWLGRDRSDDTLLRGAWAWQRPEVGENAALPGEYQPLREGVLDPTHSATVQLLGDDQSGWRI